MTSYRYNSPSVYPGICRGEGLASDPLHPRHLRPLPLPLLPWNEMKEALLFSIGTKRLRLFPNKTYLQKFNFSQYHHGFWASLGAKVVL